MVTKTFDCYGDRYVRLSGEMARMELNTDRVHVTRRIRIRCAKTFRAAVTLGGERLFSSFYVGSLARY